METKHNCKNCEKEIIVIENNLFFEGTKEETNINCPNCHEEILSKVTDGWFFVQTNEEYLKNLEIEKQKETIKFEPVA